MLLATTSPEHHETNPPCVCNSTTQLSNSAVIVQSPTSKHIVKELLSFLS